MYSLGAFFCFLFLSFFLVGLKHHGIMALESRIILYSLGRKGFLGSFFFCVLQVLKGRFLQEMGGGSCPGVFRVSKRHKKSNSAALYPRRRLLRLSLPAAATALDSP